MRALLLPFAVTILCLLQPAAAQTTKASDPLWGFNYDHDFKMRLIEEYWEGEWPTIRQDFTEMKELGANIVRVHLQFASFMEAPDKPNQTTLTQLARLIHLAEELGLQLDLTGLACYRKGDVPEWYDQMDEKARWEQQAGFWEAVAKTCKDSAAVYCYDLINEPVVPGEKRDSWLHPHELAGFSYVQFIVKDPAGRNRQEIGRKWVRKMAQAIRAHDRRTRITLGMLPMTGAGFAPKEMANELDFLSVHIYPRSGKLDESINLLKEFAAAGKPVVIEEIFPLHASAAELGEFIEQSRPYASGWIGFYWGKTPEELKESKQIGDALTLSWLELFQKMRP